jgi:hypothetical protein
MTPIRGSTVRWPVSRHCADLCGAPTSEMPPRVLSRHTGYDAYLTRAVLEAPDSPAWRTPVCARR